MTDLRFDQATADEFRTFWKGQGWRVECDMAGTRAIRMTSSGFEIYAIHNYYELWLDSYEVRVGFDPTTTFGEALDILNELAATRAFGGWAKEEGSE